ncbi:unnamed protein product, partial [Polarella glacialis]
QEKGHNGQTGKVPADTSPMEQQAGEQDAISKERVEQDNKVDEMGLKIDINMQSERQEKGHDGQIKVDELKEGLGVSHGLAHPVFAPRSDLSFGFIGVMPAGPGSHPRESPYLAIPGVFVKPPNVPLTRGDFSENLEAFQKYLGRHPPWNATAVAPDAFDALLTQLASVRRGELCRAIEEAKRLSKEIEELSKENRALKRSVAAGSGGCGSSVMETGKVPADNNNSPMEQQAGKQDAISLTCFNNTQLERQEKGHDGQTGKLPADTSPMEQQAGEQDAVSKERVEQDKKVDEMELKFDINKQPERHEKGNDPQIKVDEQEVPAGQEDEHRCLSPRSELSFGFFSVKPAGPSSHVAERSPFMALPGINFNSPRTEPRYKLARASSMSMLGQVHERRRSVEVSLSSFRSVPSGGHERRKSYTPLRSPSPFSPRDAPGTPFGHMSLNRASSSASTARDSSRQSFASDGCDTFDRELTGLHPVWKNHANTFSTQQLQWAQSKARGTGTIIDDRSSEEQDHQLYAYLWGRQAWEVLGLLMISLDLVAVPMQVFEPYPIELILITTILTTLYWTCDVPFSFVASQHSDGARHMSLKAMAGFLVLLEEYGGSKRVRIISGIAGMLVFIVLTNHLIACAFYGIATIPGLDDNWAYYAFELTGRTSMALRSLSPPTVAPKERSLMSGYGSDLCCGRALGSHQAVEGRCGCSAWAEVRELLALIPGTSVHWVPSHGKHPEWSPLGGHLDRIWRELNDRADGEASRLAERRWAERVSEREAVAGAKDWSHRALCTQLAALAAFGRLVNPEVFSTLIAAISNALQQLRELSEERTEQFAKVLLACCCWWWWYWCRCWCRCCCHH